MHQPEERIPEEIASEVLALASRMYAEQTQSYSQAELIQAGGEVQIPPELIQKAIQEVQKNRQASALQQQQAKAKTRTLQMVLIGVGIAIALWGVFSYNTLANAEGNVEAAWAQVENQLQRRADLIPNLVNVAQASARQERELISLLVQARQSYLQAETPQEKLAANQNIGLAIERFNSDAATNPQQMSSQAYTALQDELAGTENRIAVERRRYNETVQQYNRQVRRFPNNLMAGVAGFEPKPFFQADNPQLPAVNLE
ncbi:MAG: LemA family protein [Desertifilum sp. SIO1I2]|nr:LemA family protein [Desertifilum sp. SIO1I2]